MTKTDNKDVIKTPVRYDLKQFVIRYGEFGTILLTVEHEFDALLNNEAAKPVHERGEQLAQIINEHQALTEQVERLTLDRDKLSNHSAELREIEHLLARTPAFADCDTTFEKVALMLRVIKAQDELTPNFAVEIIKPKVVQQAKDQR